MIFFSKGDQLDISKTNNVFNSIMYHTRFSCMGESFLLRKAIWKNGLPGGGPEKIEKC
jgi:hypothetical protein